MKGLKSNLQSDVSYKNCSVLSDGKILFSVLWLVLSSVLNEPVLQRAINTANDPLKLSSSS